ncbi:DUF2127 domain-containing protein [Paracoccus laeviglucosivorans]|uniref:Uncharacterized membrane protein n=1 Tax=Paracoccus laeviglucosivorans TaxID=1197861 RepID=A0A521AIV3_9RHOB|nr:DUF2127 domain-containing protein [Paracoccus laeviglucosivorans]SMO34620.1 Uncharacterized membrane protein [Paracoccus laeviglucosivorans]
MSLRHIEGSKGWLHWLFESTLLVKSVFALFEIAAGLGLRLVPHQRIADFIGWLTHNSLIEGRHSPIFTRLAASLDGFTSASQHFYALYLLAHGAIKLAIIVMLMRKLAFAYPLGMAVFAGFIVTQMARWAHTGAPALLALSLLDATVIWLTWREWRVAKRA